MRCALLTLLVLVWGAACFWAGLLLGAARCARSEEAARLDITADAPGPRETPDRKE